MTVVRTIPRKSRLSTLIDKAGGLSVGVARRQAAANLDGLRDRGQAIIDARITALCDLTPPATAQDALARRVEAYRLSGEIIDAAGMFDMTPLCQAARGLCDYLDAYEEGHGPLDWRVVTVHAQSMRLLTSLPPDADDQRAAVLEHLSKVLQHKLGPKAAD